MARTSYGGEWQRVTSPPDRLSSRMVILTTYIFSDRDPNLPLDVDDHAPPKPHPHRHLTHTDLERFRLWTKQQRFDRVFGDERKQRRQQVTTFGRGIFDSERVYLGGRLSSTYWKDELRRVIPGRPVRNPFHVAKNVLNRVFSVRDMLLAGNALTHQDADSTKTISKKLEKNPRASVFEVVKTLSNRALRDDVNRSMFFLPQSFDKEAVRMFEDLWRTGSKLGTAEMGDSRNDPPEQRSKVWRVKN